MVVQSPLFKELETWRSIQQTAASIVTIINSTSPKLKASPPISTPQPITSLELHLPFPHDIVQPILALEIPEKTKQDLLLCFQRRVKELQDEFSTVYSRLWNDCSSLPRFKQSQDSLYQTCINLYRRQCFPVFESMVSRILAEVNGRQRQKKPAFNFQFTPFLETYFEENAYPQAADRRLLAQKSEMTSRQIEVWFQNHRNRAKKEGKVLRRSTSGHALEAALQTLGANRISYSLPHYEVSEITSSDDESDDDAKQVVSPLPVDSFVFDRPPNAFPTPFSHTSFPDPIPNDNGVFKFPPPNWARRPATNMRPPSAIDVDQLIQLFSRGLSIREGNGKGSRRLGRLSSNNTAWFSSRVTVPCRAPHPALIKSPSSRVSQPPRRLSSASFGFNSYPAPRSTGGHLRHGSPCGRELASRRKAFLSERRPTSAPTANAALLSNKKGDFLLRQPSFMSSTSSSQSRSSSISSLSSVGPVTPPISPVIDDPGMHGLPEPCFQALHEFSGYSNSDLRFDALSVLTDMVAKQSQSQPFDFTPAFSFPPFNLVESHS